MNYWRKPYESEKEFLAHHYGSINIIATVIFNLWRFAGIFGILQTIITGVQEILAKDYFMILSLILGIPIMFLWFFYLPTWLLKRVQNPTRSIKSENGLIMDTICLNKKTRGRRRGADYFVLCKVDGQEVWVKGSRHDWDLIPLNGDVVLYKYGNRQDDMEFFAPSSFSGQHQTS